MNAEEDNYLFKSPKGAKSRCVKIQSIYDYKHPKNKRHAMKELYDLFIDDKLIHKDKYTELQKELDVAEREIIRLQQLEKDLIDKITPK